MTHCPPTCSRDGHRLATADGWAGARVRTEQLLQWRRVFETNLYGRTQLHVTTSHFNVFKGVNFFQNLVGSIPFTFISPPLPLPASPLLTFPSLSLPSPSVPFPSLPSFPNSPPSLSPCPPLIQMLGVWGSAVSSISGSGAEPRQLTHFVYFKLGNDGRCQRCSVIVMCRKMFQTKAH